MTVIIIPVMTLFQMDFSIGWPSGSICEGYILIIIVSFKNITQCLKGLGFQTWLWWLLCVLMTNVARTPLLPPFSRFTATFIQRLRGGCTLLLPLWTTKSWTSCPAVCLCHSTSSLSPKRVWDGNPRQVLNSVPRRVMKL